MFVKVLYSFRLFREIGKILCVYIYIKFVYYVYYIYIYIYFQREGERERDNYYIELNCVVMENEKS